MKLFSAGTFCSLPSGYGNVGAYTVLAASDAEAVGLCTEQLRNDYPPRDGWANHTVVVSEVPERLLVKALAERIVEGQ